MLKLLFGSKYKINVWNIGFLSALFFAIIVDSIICRCWLALLSETDVNKTWYYSFSFFNEENLKSFISPTVSMVSISFAIISFLFNNAYKVKHFSASKTAYTLLNREIPDCYMLFLMPFFLLIFNILTFRFSFYITVLYVFVSVCRILVFLFLYNNERNVILRINRIVRSNENNYVKFKKYIYRTLKTSEENVIFAYIEICFDNDVKMLYINRMNDNFSLYLKSNFKDMLGHSCTQEYYSVFKNFYDFFKAIFIQDNLSSEYLSNILVYFLKETEIYFFNDKSVKFKDYWPLYSSLLYLTMDEKFDGRIINEYIESTEYYYQYRWLFYYYIHILKIRLYGFSGSLFQCHFLHKGNMLMTHIKPMIENRHIDFLTLSLYCYLRHNNENNLELYNILDEIIDWGLNYV